MSPPRHPRHAIVATKTPRWLEVLVLYKAHDLTTRDQFCCSFIIQDAKNRLSELVHKAMRNGPQMITVRGKTGGRRGVHLGI
ncbi:type II toxin-antitoxin system prevent-host-death family antitoxin [Kyrpidia spormannii]|uniref:type II toxin-antitoxin system prevent-host-death family antitoxin n=1 Tax=Kyrpidia spormannii TaxID=2055160 RepID=UPI001E5E1A1E|nr:type II toxin-antitoxin system prevent-host-death family antitoxin [Kyrpidia spormannii]